MKTDKSSDTMDVTLTEKPEGASSSVRGRKSIGTESEEAPAVVSSDEESSYLSSDDDLSLEDYSEEDEGEEEEEEEEEDEGWMERLRILEDARNLKRVAEFFLHPEMKVEVDSTASARCVFDRYSAPERTCPEDEVEHARIMADAQALQKFAVDYGHPEVGTANGDATACGRCYFGRASAPGEESFDDAEETAAILEDVKQLKQAAQHYLHPEEPVTSCDWHAFGRNYFSRPSAVLAETEEEREERELVLEEVMELKKVAGYYMHPETPVVVDDPCVMGRNYFTRPSAADQEEIEESQECVSILEDMELLKKHAVQYLHPEAPVTVDSTAMGRNCFSGPSAIPGETEEEAEERELVLKEAMELKKLAGHYMHPEKPVVVDDPCVMGRNYFTRPSAVDEEEIEESQECVSILEDMELLRKHAAHYLHPEAPVTVDSTAMGRNYFSGPSAIPGETEEEAEERELVLKEVMELKKLAGHYMHPEKPVVVDDPCVMGRNYFTRLSAMEQEDVEESQECVSILEDMELLKKHAGHYLHPEAPVTVDPTAMGRNYFSAIPGETEEEAKEREIFLKEAMELKKLAGYYMHPEEPVVVDDPCVVGRNYFTCPSAMEQENVEESQECVSILEDMELLKKHAVQYLHPEAPVTVDSTAMGRNYFSGPSAIPGETEEEAEERELVLKEAMELKKLAGHYMHPEKPVVVDDPCVMGRNYFTRPSAMEQEEVEESQECVSILEDMELLKKHAGNYLHPEAPVTMDPTAMGRNYFSRPSAVSGETEEEAEERERVLEDAELLKKHAVDHLHPEYPVTSIDSTVTARNYFSRASAPDQDDIEDMEERVRIMEDIKSLKVQAVFYLHPENPVTTTDYTACGRNYFNRPSAPGSLDVAHSIVGDVQATSRENEVHVDLEENIVDKSSISNAKLLPQKGIPVENVSTEEEGTMSRSQSHVMLFNSAGVEDAF